MKKITDYKFDDFYFTLGLYQEVGIDFTELKSGHYTQTDYDFNMEREVTIYTESYSEQFQYFINLLRHDKNVMGYCPFCNERFSIKVLPTKLEEELLKTVVLSVHEDAIDDYDVARAHYAMKDRINILLKNPFRDKWLQCTHDTSHIFKLSFHLKLNVDDNGNEILTITKIGQYPALSDFFTYSIRRYRDLLHEINSYKDFSSGCYMYAHGLGIGSYTYLRRVFENLITHSFIENRVNLSIDYDEFKSLRMDDKISVLKDYLPAFLIENKSIYKILSAGIHLLSEEECKIMFPVLKNAIEIIFEERIEKREKARLRDLTKKAINNLNSELVTKLSEKIDNM